jgi:peptide/nickel transport system substrate-binding protein
MAAVESGKADFLYGSPIDAYDRLKAHPDLKVQIVKNYATVVSVLNKKQGLFTNVKLRQAVLAALDMEAILRTAIGHHEL